MSCNSTHSIQYKVYILTCTEFPYIELNPIMQGRQLNAFWQQDMNDELWVDIWYTTFTTVRTAVLTPCIILLVFTVLRLAGHRSLAESTLFNKISIVALGSLVGGTALRPNTPLVAVAIATVIIIGFSVAVSFIYMHGWIPACILRPQPTLLWVDGHFIDKHMHHCELTQEKVHSELRSKGYVNMTKLFAIILEPPGKFAVITKSAVDETQDWELLQGLRGYDEYLKHLQQKGAGQDRAPNGCLDC